MDQPCSSETWSRPLSSWTYKISAEQKWQHERCTFFLMAMNYVDSKQYQVFMLTKGLLPRNFYWLNHQGIKTVLYKKRETVLVQVMKDVSKQVKLTVWKNRMKYEFLLPAGKNLRKILIEKGVSPYSAFNNKINCRGNGLCATCGVFVMDSDPTPTHWHDRIARAFGYPRLSCQIEIREDMEIEIPPKWIWGKRRKKSDL